MRRILAFIIAVTMICSGFNAFAQVESFDEETAGWTVDSGSKKVLKPGSDKDEKCVVISGRNQKGVWRSLYATGIVTFEAEVFYKDNTVNVKIPEIKAKNEEGMEATVVSVEIINGALTALYYDGMRDTRSSMLISKNVWNKITVEVNTEKDTFSVWLNGETVVLGKKFSNAFNAKYLTKISYYSTSPEGETYIDNLNMYMGTAKGVKQITSLAKEDIIFEEDFNGKISGWSIDPLVQQVEKPGALESGDKAMMIPAGFKSKLLSKNLGEISDIVTIEA